MLFNSTYFFIFIAIVLPTYFLSPVKWRKYLLLIMSYTFYGFWDWRFCSLLFISTAIDFACGLKMASLSDKKLKRPFLLISLATNLGILGFFKYFNFFTDNLRIISSHLGYDLGTTTLNIVLPVGISFYTLQTLSYTFDIYKGKVSAEKNFLTFANYVSFFPQLVAGPIERASVLLPQVKNLGNPTKRQIEEGLSLLALGFFKKVVISDNIAPIADKTFANPQLFQSYDLLVGLLVFGVQIYFDFSGYSKIARGVAKFFGINLSVNFRQPYFSKNPTEFWSRWHITLTQWVRDYIYIPLAKKVRSELGLHGITLFSMLVIGLWHGANWTFIAFGALEGALLIAHKIGRRTPLTTLFKGPASTITKIAFAQIFLWPIFVFFRSPNIESAAVYISRIFTTSFTANLNSIMLPFYLVAILLLVDYPAYKENNDLVFLKMNKKVRYLAYILILGGTLLLLTSTNNQRPFIYFQF